MSDITTVKDSKFPTYDITHKPRRSQSDNLKKAGKFNVEDVVEDLKTSNIPQSPTLERAIQFFEENAKGEYKVLYTNTAKWLRNYLTDKVKKLPNNIQAILPNEIKEVVSDEDNKSKENDGSKSE